MQPKPFILLLFFALSAGVVCSQTCPPNLDFENGDFSNWECFTGTTKASNGQNQMLLTLTGPVANRHEIISANTTGGALDVYGLFPKLCPYGGNYSVRLGNNSTGAQAEGLSYTFQVPATVDTFTFTYFYAVVFENPSHTLPEQPRFFCNGLRRAYRQRGQLCFVRLCLHQLFARLSAFQAQPERVV